MYAYQGRIYKYLVLACSIPASSFQEECLPPTATLREEVQTKALLTARFSSPAEDAGTRYQMRETNKISPN